MSDDPAPHWMTTGGPKEHQGARNEMRDQEVSLLWERVRDAEAEVARLREALANNEEGWRQDRAGQSRKIAALEAEVARLRWPGEVVDVVEPFEDGDRTK